MAESEMAENNRKKFGQGKKWDGHGRPSRYGSDALVLECLCILIFRFLSKVRKITSCTTLIRVQLVPEVAVTTLLPFAF